MIGRRGVGICLAVCTTLVGAGCGGQRYVRETTRTLADDVASLQRDLARHAVAHQEAAARRIDRIMKERRQLADGEQEIAVRLDKLSGAETLYSHALTEARTRVGLEKSLAERLVSEREALKGTQGKFDAQLASQLEALASQLSELGTLPSLKAQGEFLFKYFQSTADEVGKLEKAAKESTDKAQAPAGGTGR